MAATNSNALISVFKERRSVYALSDESTVPDSRIKEIVEEVMLSAPSPFNVQSCRAVVLLNNEHKKFWDLAAEAFAASVPPPVFQNFKPKLDGLKAAYGSVLFYEDPDSYEAAKQRMGDKWNLVADKMPQWTEHSNAMQQYAIWTCLVAEGMACNLQHYNPLVDSRVTKTWGVPETWSHKAQLVFGKPTGGPNDKVVKPIEGRAIFHSS